MQRLSIYNVSAVPLLEELVEPSAVPELLATHLAGEKAFAIRSGHDRSKPPSYFYWGEGFVPNGVEAAVVQKVIASHPTDASIWLGEKLR